MSVLMYGQGIAGAITTIGNVYTQYKAAQAARELWNIQKKTQEYLIADALETIANSTKDVIREMTDKAKRQEFEVLRAAEQARGQAVAAQANTGAQGQRVSLATNQATYGEADRQLGYLAADLDKQIDATLDQQEYQSKKTVQNVLSGSIDAPPSGYGLGEAIVELGSVGLQTYAAVERRDLEERLAASKT